MSLKELVDNYELEYLIYSQDFKLKYNNGKEWQRVDTFNQKSKELIQEFRNKKDNSKNINLFEDKKDFIKRNMRTIYL